MNEKGKHERQSIQSQELPLMERAVIRQMQNQIAGEVIGS